MSVIGFDIGNENCVIAAAKRGGIDVLLNDESKRETPSVVSFGEKQRFLGSAGAASATANPKSTISQVKRLVGRVYKDPSVQEDLKLLPFATSEGPRGGILIELDYMKEKQKFTPVEILGMLFKHLKQIAEKNLESAVVDCVIGIPSYFTDLQRREYLDAAFIAGLNPLRLMHDCTATALGYGMYNTDFSNSGPMNVIFVDIGHCDTQVTVAVFKKGKMKILSHSFDQNLGGRDFDEVLFKHFATQFKDKHNIDVYSHARASIRLRASCEKVKKVLSANAEAPLSIDCLIGDTDVRGIITREEFENLSSELLERVTIPCSNALKDAGISIDKISTIELVGSGSRIPAIVKKLTSVFQKEPTRTLNASECVARGCALRCAMLSPTQKVRNYEFWDFFPYLIAVPLDELKDKTHRQVMLFPKGSPFPRSESFMHTRKTPFYFHVLYANKKDLPAGISPRVGRFRIGSSETPSAEKVKIEFKMKLNGHGIIELESATLIEDKRSSSMNIYSYLGRSSVDSHVSNLACTENLDATTKDELLKAQERERMLAEQDIKVEQIKDQRNTLESYVYDTRSKLSSAYRSFVTDSEEEAITNSLQKTEDWLYEDSDDESDQDYTVKLKDLKKLLDPIEKRYKDENARAQATKALQSCVEKYRTAANSLPPKQKNEVLNVCNGAEQWLNSLSSPKADHILWIEENIQVLKRDCKDIIRSKPSFPKHDKPMHPDQRDWPIVSNQRDQPVDSNQKDRLVDLLQRDQPMHPDQRDRPIVSNQRDQPMDSNQKDRLVDLDPRDQRMYPDQRYQPFVSNQRDEPVDWNQKDRLVDLDPRDQRMYPDQRYQPFVSNQRDQLVGWNQKDRLVDLDQRDQPMYPDQGYWLPVSNQRYQPVDWNQKDRLVDLDQRDQRMYPDQRYQPFVSNQRDEPVDWNQKDRLMDIDQRDQPMHPDQRYRGFVSNQRDQPVDWNQKNRLVDFDQRDQPKDSDQREQPVKFRQRDQPVDFDQRDQPKDSDQREQPVKFRQRDQPMDSNQMKQAVDSDQREQPVKFRQRDQPVDSNQMKQAVDLDQREQPVKFCQRDQPVGSNQMKQAGDSDQHEDMEVDK